MTEKKKYPEEIYKDAETGGEHFIPRFRETFEKAYDLGFRDRRFKERLEASNPLAGWSNLTEAIQDGERIDWDALDGIEAKCVHPEIGILTSKLDRDPIELELEKAEAWFTNKADVAWGSALLQAWRCADGWSLWVKGDLPLRKRTADELEPGTCFRARFKRNGTEHNYKYAQLVNVTPEKQVVICYSHQLVSIFNRHYAPGEVEAIEVYGIATFPAPKEEA